MKKIVIFVFFIGGAFWFLNPKSYFYFSEKLDHLNGKANAFFLKQIKNFIDPSFISYRYAYNLSAKSLDVIIPLVEKDIVTARHAIIGVRSMVMHPIGKIYLVAPNSEKIKEFAKEMNCEFVLENDVLENFDEIKKLGGWVLQQFLKLSANKISNSENILIVDADTIFIRPQVFINDKKERYTFNIHDQYVIRRKNFTKKLLKTNIHYKLDFVAHHMIFKKEWLESLQKHIEAVHGKPWNQVIVDMVKNQGGYDFSEYDIYATYVMINFSKNARVLSSANCTIYRDRFDYLDLYRPVYQKDYKSLSSHSFITTEYVNKN